MLISEKSLTNFAQKEPHRFKLKAGVFLLIIKEGTILLLRRYHTGIGDGEYVVPMGGLEGKETVTQAAIREAYEETNIIIKPENIQLRHVMHRYHPMPQNLSFEQLDFFFYVENYEGIIINKEPHKCDELQFYALNNLPGNTVPFIKHAIACAVDGIIFSEFGWKF